MSENAEKGVPSALQAPVVEMRGITKTFGSEVANDSVNLSVRRGEVLALLGENGSGKTTLMNMLSGIYYPDAGTIFVDGREVAINSPRDAAELGIGMLHQHFKLVDVFTMVENVVLGTGGAERFDLKAAAEKIKRISDSYGFDVDPWQKVYEMSVSQKQTAEIVKLIYHGAEILILDEPTAVLTPQEADRLFAVLRNMRDDGKAIIIITHKLHEVMDISDRVVILRKGHHVADLMTSQTNEQEMTDLMVGHKVSLNIERPLPVNPHPRIDVRDLTVKSSDGIPLLDRVSFTVNTGEILGVAGISGSGQKELLEAIAGLQPVSEGTITYIDDDGTGVELVGMDPRAISAMGVALSFVPEDRLGMGLVANMNITDNMMLRSYREGHSPFTDRKAPAHLARKVVNELEVQTAGITTPVRRMSGGNVQKVLVGREIAADPKVLLTAYAVRGLDINSSYTIYDLINRQKQRGVAVLYVGEDLDVLIELSDRILVLCDGKVSGIIDGRTADKNEVGLMMTKMQGKGGDEHGATA